MKKVFLTAALAVVVGLSACDAPKSATYVNASGSIALSRDDTLIYAVDSDNEILAVVDAATQKKVAEVKVGAAPEQVAVGPDDAIYVSNRGARSVSVIQKGQWEEARRIPVGVEPVGLAVAPDGKTLYVVNGTSLEDPEYGTLMAIDTASGQPKWDLAVGEEPRAVTLIDGGKKALITLFKQGDVVQVDLTRPEIIKDNTRAGIGQNRSAVYEKANLAGLQGQTSASTSSKFMPRSASSITATPDGETAFMTVVWSREDNITAAPNRFGGYYAGGGPCSVGSVATAGLVTYTADSAEPKVDDLTTCSFAPVEDNKDYPTNTFSTFNGNTLQGPVASVVDPTGSWLFVLNRESQNVAIMPTSRRTGDDLSVFTNGTNIREVVPVGQGANGIAITRDGKVLYVYNQFDHAITVLKSFDAAGGTRVAQAGNPIVVARDVIEDAAFIEGRKLFFSALNADINNPTTTGVSCNTCHVEGGREDGHVWGFPDGQRQTPALAGRMMSRTAPFHWSGEFTDLQAFMDHTTVARMGGIGVNANELNALIAYMDKAPAADNPQRLTAPTDAQVRGAQVFVEANCSSCHGGEAMTLNTMADVGTLRSTDRVRHESGINNELLTALNTPSLLGLARTAPYLHDGSAKTLKERLLMNAGDRHGKTSHLSEQQIDDLVAYLKTL